MRQNFGLHVGFPPSPQRVSRFAEELLNMEGSPATKEGSSVSGLEVFAAVDAAPTPDAVL